MSNRKAFTLLEVLISIALLGIVILALFSSVDMMQDSNQQLAQYLEKSKKTTNATKVLYLDMMDSDGNITITKDEFSRVCMADTPLRSEERVEIDPVMMDIEVFDVYHEKDKVLVLIQQQGKEPISFMLQGITKPVKKKIPIEKKATTTL